MGLGHIRFLICHKGRQRLLTTNFMLLRVITSPILNRRLMKARLRDLPREGVLQQAPTEGTLSMASSDKERERKPCGNLGRV